MRINESYFNDNKLNSEDNYASVYNLKSLDYKCYLKFGISIQPYVFELHTADKSIQTYLIYTRLTNLLNNIDFIDFYEMKQEIKTGWNFGYKIVDDINPTKLKPMLMDLYDYEKFKEEFKKDTGKEIDEKGAPSYHFQYDITVDFQPFKVSFEQFIKGINMIMRSVGSTKPIHLYEKFTFGVRNTGDDRNETFEQEIRTVDMLKEIVVKSLYTQIYNVPAHTLGSMKEIIYKRSRVEDILDYFLQNTIFDVTLKNKLKTTYTKNTSYNSVTFNVLFMDLEYTQSKHKELGKNQVLYELKNLFFIKLPLELLREWKVCIKITSNKNFATEVGCYPKPTSAKGTSQRKQGHYEFVSNTYGSRLEFTNFYRFTFIGANCFHDRGYVVFLDLYGNHTNRRQFNYYESESFANLIQKSR